MVTKLDRAGRSLRHLLELVNGLDRRGIGFRSLSESIDTTTPSGKLVFHLFASLAEFERDLTRSRLHRRDQRVREARRRRDVGRRPRRRRGRHPGGHVGEPALHSRIGAEKNLSWFWCPIGYRQNFGELGGGLVDREAVV